MLRVKQEDDMDINCGDVSSGNATIDEKVSASFA